jgi:hypothetical protein
MKISAFPKALGLGHRDIEDIFDSRVEITEKLDGSQFAFGKIQGQLLMRSKGQMIEGMVDKLFKPAVEHVLVIEKLIPDNTVFYVETLSKPKHNVMAYDRIPKNHMALFAVKTESVGFCDDYTVLANMAFKLDIDVVPLLYSGKADVETALNILDTTDSYLGGGRIEGIVIKNYQKNFKSLMPGKLVSERFREKQGVRKRTTKGQKWVEFKESFRTEARWQKAVQHLQEMSQLKNEPSDIGILIKEVHRDIIEEEQAYISDMLFKHFGKELLQHATRGFPEWYKEKIGMVQHG